MSGPRVIEKHAFVIPSMPNPGVGKGAYDEWSNGGNKLCAVLGCHLPYEAEPHWELAHEHEDAEDPMLDFAKTQIEAMHRVAAAQEAANIIGEQRLEQERMHNEMHLRGTAHGEKPS